jgi:U4/U6.U5 tri-snRNP-associated protein 1
MKRKEEEDAAATAAATLMDGGDLETVATTNKSDRITFEVDEIQEFTRALRARDNEDQSSLRRNSIDGSIIIGEKDKEEEDGGKAPSHVLTVPDANANNIVATSSTLKAESDVVESTDDVDDDADMEEMARDMEVDDESIIDDDDHDDLDDTTSGLTREAPIGGRGMSSFLSHLRHTGEIRNHSTKEEMRGRAKDKRTYEDYEKLDLSTVVKIGTNGTAPHEKDAELARREIKLEYRDEHGRLLTRKEAYRDMCYQFHGHGSSKKNQERRLKQIEKERTEGSKGGTAGSASTVGTLGALKATQKATGKAFIIHKT